MHTVDTYAGHDVQLLDGDERPSLATTWTPCPKCGTLTHPAVLRLANCCAACLILLTTREKVAIHHALRAHP